MADPLRDLDTSSRIEELLLAGLDHYFSGQHELAISVWTRVLFFDRSHPRARAYIERARGAIAERQREGEELLQTGMAAFERGDTAHARELLTAAVERHAQPEEARALIERIDRLAPPPAAAGGDDPAASRPGALAKRSRTILSPQRTGVSAATIVAVLAVGLAAGALAVIGWTSGVLPWPPAPQPVTSAQRAPLESKPEPLPVPSASEVSLARATSWYKDGHLRDALSALDAIRPGDPLRPRADELRATIQQKLLEAARASEPR